MPETSKQKSIYSEIQKQLFYMIPEKWDKVYLYASVINHYDNVQTGEMFFYYYPKSVLRKNPINVYEVPNKFNIDEEAYLKLAERLYTEIKRVRKIQVEHGEEEWSNITIKVENFKFNVEYYYDDLITSKYTSYDRHLIWRYKYLKTPLSSYQKKDKEMIEEYLAKEKFLKNKMNTYSEGVYNNTVSDIVEYDKEEVKIEPKEVILREADKTKDKKCEEEQIIITSQILKY